MFEFVKSEISFDWNANETPIDSLETGTPVVRSADTKMNSVEEFTDNTEAVFAKRKVDKPYTGKQKIPTRSKVCTVVPVNHFGPIPGIPVGTCWEKRIQVSEAGVHRPSVAGIHGREREGAYSIVFSGTYAEDQDFGDEFFYSGCGGGVTDPHKMISGQKSDQTLTHHNKALALSCNAPVNDQVGADAENWRAGKPIRVIRTYKLKKHSIYAPDEGNRYDGIYKVVKYFPIIGQCGLVVWRFLLRRDDPEPAPWTDEGKQAIAEKNLQIIRAEKTDYVKPLDKGAIKKNGKQLSGKSPLENNAYSFPDEETFERIIRDALQSTSDVEDGETGSALDWLLTKSKSKKSWAQQSPKKRTKTKSKKSRTLNATRNQKFKKIGTKSSKNQCYEGTSFQCLDKKTGVGMMDLEMGMPTTNAGRVKVKPDSSALTNELLESPRKRNRKQDLNEFLNTDPCEYPCFPFFGTENGQKELVNAQIDYHILPTSEMEETDENDYNQSEAVEIVPDISFLQANVSPGPLRKRNGNFGSNRSRLTTCQPIESASKLSIKVVSVKSLNRKNVAANCKTPRNRKRNAGRNRMTDPVEPLKPQNQIDLTTDEDEPYVLPLQIEKFIDSDTLNKTIWEYCRKNFLRTEADFMDVVKLMFICRYCSQLAANPVTTPCDHNVCLGNTAATNSKRGHVLCTIPLPNSGGCVELEKNNDVIYDCSNRNITCSIPVRKCVMS